MVGQQGLKAGNTIKCADKEDMLDTAIDLFRSGYDIDFIYEKDDREWLGLEILGVGE